MIQCKMLAVRRAPLGALFLLLVSIHFTCTRYSPDVGPRADYLPLTEKLERLIAHEMQDKALPALSIALVDDESMVWAKGFGMADPDKKIAATAETVYRVGSVSKLFTDIAIMQLVESGELDLEAPVTHYLPEFQPQHSFGKPITLRQLMSHRSGLVREPPVGNYFDDTAPTLGQTVTSLNSTTLVYEPETRLKYSNAGIAVVGYVLERLKGKPFAKYLKRAVLEPLGMRKSAFEPAPEIIKDLAKASMWTYDGRLFEAPTFQLGMAPAGSMYSTVVDLGRFMTMLFKRGNSAGGRILQPASLEQMWRPQFAPPEQKSGFGIGFAISEFQGYRRVGHGGAIYGFATELATLPDAKLGVVAVTSMDVANAVVDRIADYALELMLAKRHSQPLPEIDMPDTLNSQLARQLAGRDLHDEQPIDLIERTGALFVSQR
ncbi:MAG: beta-lactamase family protein, partial [candidate division KSB1 bacterium]|nr:beta-lactamase family protein [candidate division KSB1 bacterium]